MSLNNTNLGHQFNSKPFIYLVMNYLDQIQNVLAGRSAVVYYKTGMLGTNRSSSDAPALKPCFIYESGSKIPLETLKRTAGRRQINGLLEPTLFIICVHSCSGKTVVRLKNKFCGDDHVLGERIL